jgi:small subunit ribosomal protein S1
LHISELADHKVESPEDVVKVGDEIEVRILRVDAADRKIGLSRKTAGSEEEGAEATTEAGGARAAKRQLRGGTESGGGQLFSLPGTGGEGEAESESEGEPQAEASDSVP